MLHAHDISERKETFLGGGRKIEIIARAHTVLSDSKVVALTGLGVSHFLINFPEGEKKKKRRII